jgi:hypothetical protein
MRAIICSFSGSLSDVPRNKRGDEEFVLGVLRRDGRFSCFEASEHQKLAETLVSLKTQGRIVYPKPQPAYPWCRVEVVK